MNNVSIFRINQEQYLKFKIDHVDPTIDSGCCQEFVLEYVDEAKNITLEIGKVSIIDFCERLKNPENIKLLQGKVKIHESITQDIGKVFNQGYPQELIRKIIDLFFTSNSHDQQSAQKVHTWLYNDLKGKIILQVNSAFEWKSHYRRNCKEFKNFLKQYQMFTVVIPKYRFKQWIFQSNKLYEKFRTCD